MTFEPAKSNRTGATFGIRLTGFVLLQLPIIAAVLYWGRPSISNHYLAAFADKHARMLEPGSRRLILLGGSNVAFGIDSTRLLERTGRQPINLGLYVRLGLEYQLAMVRRHGRSGDTVIISAEYELLTNGLRPVGDRDVEDLIEYVPTAVTYFESSGHVSWKRFADEIALRRVRQYVNRAIDRFKSRDRLYDRGSFDRFGDVVAHAGADSKPFEMPTIDFDPTGVRESIERLNRFADACQSRGIDVFLSHPPVPTQRLQHSFDRVRSITSMLADELRIPMLDRQSDQRYDRSQFLDTCYHLRRSAATRRSDRIVDTFGVQRVAATVESHRRNVGGQVESSPTPDHAADRSRR